MQKYNIRNIDCCYFFKKKKYYLGKNNYFCGKLFTIIILMEDILKKIRELRNVRGFSYENMADELHISTSTYRKIENNETKLTVERLYQISKVLQAPVNYFLGEKVSNIFYQNNNESETLIGNQNVENYYHQENRETTQKLIATMEREIEHLQKENSLLLKMLEKDNQ